jgi:chemotaxis protein CheX
MPARATLSQELIDRSIAKSLDSVFTTLTKSSVHLTERTAILDPSVLGDGPQIMGCVGFVGEMNGVIYLRFTEEFATSVTGLVLGMSVNEVRMEGFEILKDTIGELTNMSVGGFKNAFSDIGYPCALTLPTIIRGEKLVSPTIKGAVRHVYHFANPAGRLIADLQLKSE